MERGDTWQPPGLGTGRRAVTSATSITAADQGVTIDATSGTFTVGATAAATLGSGFSCALYNSGTGVVTLDPNGSETVRTPSGTSTTIVLKQGEGVFLSCTGTGFEAISYTRALSFYVRDFGAAGDDAVEDSTACQKAIDAACNAGGGDVVFGPGTYRITSKSLVVWGSNVTLRGAGRGVTIIKKYGSPGYWGDAVDVAGKINGYQYWGLSAGGVFGAGDYGTLVTYTGSTTASNNCAVRDLTITHDAAVTGAANNLGVLAVEGLELSDLVLTGAPQTNLACVNETTVAAVGKVYAVRCEFSDSSDHNVRVNSYAAGALVGNRVTFRDCRFLRQLAAAGAGQAEITGRWVHLYFRGGVDSSAVYCSAENCYFDSTASIASTNNARGLSVVGCVIENGVYVSGSTAIVAGVNFQRNRFTGAASKTGATSEHYIKFQNVIGLDFSENILATTLVSGNTLTTVGLYSCQHAKVMRNVGLSLSLAVFVDAVKYVDICDNAIQKNSVLTTERGLNILGDNIHVRGNHCINSMCYLSSGTLSRAVIADNYFYLTTNEGVGVVDGAGTLSQSVVRGNLVEGAGAFPVSRQVNPTYAGNIVAGNIILNSDATVQGEETFGTAAPVAGTFQLGARRWNTTPTAGGNIGWACTTAGTPGTWTPFGGSTFLDSLFRVTGSSDATKMFAVEADTQGAGFTTTLNVGAQTGSRTITLPVTAGSDTLAALGVAQTFTAQQQVQAAGAFIHRQAATQDGVALLGRAGGTSSYTASLTPTTLTASRVLTLPDATTTIAGLSVAQTFSVLQTFSFAGSGIHQRLARITAAVGAVGVGAEGDREAANTYDQLNIYNGASSGRVIVRLKDSGGYEIRSSGISATLTLVDAVSFSSNVAQTGATTLSTGTGATSLNGQITLADAINIAVNATTGTKIGTATSQKLGFWNATPVIQPASASQAAVATTAATNVSPYGYSTQAQADGIITLLNEIRSALVSIGAIKGAA